MQPQAFLQVDMTVGAPRNFEKRSGLGKAELPGEPMLGPAWLCQGVTVWSMPPVPKLLLHLLLRGLVGWVTASTSSFGGPEVLPWDTGGTASRRPGDNAKQGSPSLSWSLYTAARLSLACAGQVSKAGAETFQLPFPLLTCPRARTLLRMGAQDARTLTHTRRTGQVSKARAETFLPPFPLLTSPHAHVRAHSYACAHRTHTRLHARDAYAHA